MAEKIQFLGRSRIISGNLRKEIRQTLTQLCDNHCFMLGSLCYIHMNDDELLQINQEHLNHDTYTDIITFDLSDQEGVIDGEIYLSLERIKENAHVFGGDFFTEYVRVVSHGLLHLLGYADKSESETRTMRNKEQEAIDIWSGLRST